MTNRLCIRFLDLLVASLGLIISSPALLLLIFAIRLDSPGPAFFNQYRIGLKGRCFLIHKFRTMNEEACADSSGSFVAGRDARVTGIGYFLRRYHLDEIPQLVNVIKGDMSIVGPRPFRDTVNQAISEIEPRWSKRLEFKPGLTGPAQLYAARGESLDAHAAKLPFDLSLKNLTVGKYLRLCLETLWKMMSGSSS